MTHYPGLPWIFLAKVFTLSRKKDPTFFYKESHSKLSLLKIQTNNNKNYINILYILIKSINFSIIKPCGCWHHGFRAGNRFASQGQFRLSRRDQNKTKKILRNVKNIKRHIFALTGTVKIGQNFLFAVLRSTTKSLRCQMRILRGRGSLRPPLLETLGQ